MLTWNRMSARQRARAASTVALALLLAACSNGGDEARARHEAAQHPKPDAAVSAPEVPDTQDMVSAVGATDAMRPVSLKFRLAAPPRVGEPLQLMLALTQEPKLVIDALHLALLPREGLQLKSPAKIDFLNPQSGALHMIPVSLEPEQLGVLSLAVTVLVNTERDSVARSYTIPLIVVPAEAAAAAPVAVTKPPAAPVPRR
jgi:hypothetical protein